MSASESPLLETHHLARRHPGGLGWLLEDINLQLEAGERLAVVGPSGAGKTLLLRALALLDPLDRGEVCWRRRPIRRDRVPEFRRHVIYLHQRPALMADTVEGALRQPFSLQVHHQQVFRPDWVVEQLKRLGRDRRFLEKRVRDLSGGESQITALLRAMQLEPEVLLLDEPTAAMDPATSEAAEQLIDSWMAQAPGARALVWVSHDRAQTDRVGRRTVFIEAGRLRANR
jgi:putative ABC transport system ATP-binding protein